MSWGEAIRLVGVLGRDPSSQLAAAINDWSVPRSPEWLVLADLFDATTRAHFTRPQSYPRPYQDPGDTRIGKTDRPRAEVIELLNRFGHDFDPDDDDEE